MRVYNPEKFSVSPSAILFDTDNTLYEYKPAHGAAVDAVRAKVGAQFSIKSDEFDESFREARTSVKARLGNTAASHSRLLYFQRMLEMLGLGSQVLLALDLEQTYWRTFLTNARLYPNVTLVLEQIKMLGIPTAIVTDLTAQIQFRKIVYFGLDHYFDFIVTSEEAGADKPAPSQFELAVEKIQPKGNSIWMIGDSPVSDIQGARQHIDAITLQKVRRMKKDRDKEIQPDVLFQDFRELLQLFGNSGN